MVQKVKQQNNDVTDYITHLLLTVVVFPDTPPRLRVDKVLVTVNLAAGPEHDEPYDYDMSHVLNEYLKTGSIKKVFDLENIESVKPLHAVLPPKYKTETVSIIDVEEVAAVIDRSMPYGIVPHVDPQEGIPKEGVK
jgi:hypothetical protein